MSKTLAEEMLVLTKSAIARSKAENMVEMLRIATKGIQQQASIGSSEYKIYLSAFYDLENQNIFMEHYIAEGFCVVRRGGPDMGSYRIGQEVAEFIISWGSPVVLEC